MSRDDFIWMAGGPQGSGVDSSANIFARACCYGGLHVYGQREYHSNIKGLHSYFHIRVSPNELRAIASRVDMLCAFDADSVVRHVWEVSASGGIVCDAEILPKKLTEIPTLSASFREEFQKTLDEKGIKPETVGDLLNEAKKGGVKIYAVSYLELLKLLSKELGEEKLSKLTIMTNILALGISFGIVNYDKKYVATAIEKIFGKKAKIISTNVLAFNLAHDYATMNFKDFGFSLDAVQTDEKRIFIQGTQAVALGKLAGGCRFQSYYPITPAGDESTYLEENEVFELEKTALKQQGGSILVMQTEDEIAAVNMASSAALTGARAATSTSGPGFSLMVEGLGWQVSMKFRRLSASISAAVLQPGFRRATARKTSGSPFMLHTANSRGLYYARAMLRNASTMPPAPLTMLNATRRLLYT